LGNHCSVSPGYAILQFSTNVGLDLLRDDRQHAINVGIHFSVGEPKETQAESFEVRLPEPISLTRVLVDRAVELAGPLSWIEEGFGERQTLIAHPKAWGDVVTARKDTPTSYHLSVVVDDALQGVTNVVRGRDLYHATSVHVLLQKLLGLPSPVYHHHRLIVDANGRKLSKSDRDMSLRSLRDAGKTPADIRRMVGLEEEAGGG